MTSEEIKQLPFAWVCLGGPSCPAETFGTDPEREALQGCPNCARTAIDKHGNGTDYRLPRH